MEIEVYNEISECVEICQSLSSLLEQDWEGLEPYLKGVIFDEYKSATILAAEQIEDMKQRLLMLQSALSNGL